MVLQQVDIVNGPRSANIHIDGNLVTGVIDNAELGNDKGLRLKLNNALAFPGLINSHDHLDFNLFPQLGYKKYTSYREWGPYIHKTYAAEIGGVLKVPVHLREDWGMLKNLLCGVTTVVNHGEKLQTSNRLINVFEHCHNLHSVGFEKKWRLKVNNPFKKQLPVVIHAGEGTDSRAHKEIDRLIKWNLLGRKLIGIHGVAMSSSQAERFRALVWCPQSNEFLLGKTAQVDKLEKHTDILFGTDSTLTGSWDIWEHIRYARQLQLLGDEDLYNSLSATAAYAWKISSGKIKKDKPADIVIARNKGLQNDFANYFAVTPEDILLVMCGGEIMLFDEELLPQLEQADLSGFSKIYLNGHFKYIRFNVPKLIDEIKAYYPHAALPVTKTAYAFA